MLSTTLIKSKISLSEASKLTNFPLSEGTNDCPFCKRKKKLTVKEKNYKCHHPSCSKKGDVFSYLVDTKLCSSFIEAYRYLSRETGISTFSFETRRASLSTLEKVMQAYSSLVDYRSVDYLTERGYTDLDFPFGYAPTGTPLQDYGIPLSELLEIHMAYPNGKEYYQNRIVFPITRNGVLVHMQARDLARNSKLRWKATKTIEGSGVGPITNYLYNYDQCLKLTKEHSTIFMCEGITDTRSLIELGLPVFGSFGVNVDLVRHGDLLEKVNCLVVMLDGDRYSIDSHLNGQYKSWSQIIYSLKDLKESFPHLKIVCCPPIQKQAIKDINDWFNKGLTKEDLKAHIIKTGRLLVDFCIEEFGQWVSYHPFLLELIKVTPTPNNKRKMEDLILKTSAGGLVDYLLSWS